MRCTFCATGKGGFARNLLPHEIVCQVLTVQEQFGLVRLALLRGDCLRPAPCQARHAVGRPSAYPA